MAPTHTALSAVSGVLVAVVLWSFGSVAQERRRICFVDEAATIESLAQFREELRAAVKMRDVEGLRPLVTQDIEVWESQAVLGRGFDAFVDYFKFGDPSNSVWDELDRILSLGGVMDSRGAFCAPYFTCPTPPAWEPDEVLVLGTDVPAHAQPDGTSPVVERLSCDVLKIVPLEDLGGGMRPGWEGVQLGRGKVAFVESRFLEMPGLYLRIAQRDGKWMLVGLYGTD